MSSCPHIFLAGSQPKFDTASIEGPEGQVVRLIAVPKFAETSELVLVDAETLETSVVRISVA
jgi:DNA polymerase delta subunit 2